MGELYDSDDAESETLTVIPGLPGLTHHETVEQPLEREARLVVLAGPLFGQSFPVETGITTMGRSSENTVGLRDQPGVSRNHARIVSKPGGVFHIEDLGSRNGTWVNGVEAKKKSMPIRFGDRIQLGADCTLLFTYIDPAEEQLEHLRRMETVGRMTAGIAHDFNNLLMVILTSLRQLDDLEGDSRDAVEDGLVAAEQAVSLTEKILSLSRPTAAEKCIISVEELIDETAKICKRMLPPHVRLAITCERDLQVWGYAVELQQVLMNLVINARDAMPEGGVLQVRARKARTSEEILGGGPDRIVISVTDSGIGMDETTRQRVFDPFFTTKDHSHGTGLGLATALAAVQRHGGTFHVRSEPGEGSTFRVFLPAADASEQRERTDPPLRSTPGRGLPRRATRVLVVDDEPLVLRSTARQLRKLGYVPSTFGDPIDALRALGTAEFDAAIVDLHLDGTTALEVIPQIRDLRKDLPILVFSGHWTEQQGNTLRQMGAAMLQKPCTADGLHGMLCRLTGATEEPSAKRPSDPAE